MVVLLVQLQMLGEVADALVSTRSAPRRSRCQPAVRACSWMISVLASLVNVMVERQGYQRQRPSDLQRRSAHRRIRDQLAGPRHIRLDRGHELVDGVVADLIPEP
jgi:hypothetical protein